MLSTNLGRDSDQPELFFGFLQPFSKVPRQQLALRHDRPRLYLYQFVIHL